MKKRIFIALIALAACAGTPPDESLAARVSENLIRDSGEMYGKHGASEAAVVQVDSGRLTWHDDAVFYHATYRACCHVRWITAATVAFPDTVFDIESDEDFQAAWKRVRRGDVGLDRQVADALEFLRLTATVLAPVRVLSSMEQLGESAMFLTAPDSVARVHAPRTFVADGVSGVEFFTIAPMAVARVRLIDGNGARAIRYEVISSTDLH